MYINNFVSTIDKDRLSGKISRNLDTKSKFIQLQYTVHSTLTAGSVRAQTTPIFLKLYSFDQPAAPIIYT